MKRYIRSSRACLLLVSCLLVLMAIQNVSGQNQVPKPCSLSGQVLNYPDGPARDPGYASGMNNDIIPYAPNGSISVNENTTYNAYTPTQLVQNILVTGCLYAYNVTFTGVFNTSDPNRRHS